MFSKTSVFLHPRYGKKARSTMSYDAKVFNVMIASPGDVSPERSIVKEVTYEWNAVHSYARKIALMPIGWESHSSPEMGASPQEIINNQVLDKCDLLVGVFWTRIGTATTDYASGTVEEIEKHIETGKPTMLYFSSQPVAMDSVDMAQIEELKKFKDSCRSRGLYETYDSHTDFRLKLSRHLQLKINEHSIFESQAMPGAIASLPPLSVAAAPSTLSQEAKILLKEASSDPHGVVMHLRYVSGTDIQSNGKKLNQSSERREVARWESAIEELVKEHYLVARGAKGEIYEVTNTGYLYASTI